LAVRQRRQSRPDRGATGDAAGGVRRIRR
jgi:hypothetical protein